MTPHIVIAGGGIIGASTAYYLALRGVKPTVIDSCTPACSASGKAGGFLALDWCDYGTLGSLARESFRLHQELADSLDTDCGYRRMRAYAAELKKGSSRSKAHGIPWVEPIALRNAQQIGTEKTVAQVHPRLLTLALLEKVEQMGGKVMSHTKADTLVVATEESNGGIQNTGQNDTHLQNYTNTATATTEPVQAKVRGLNVINAQDGSMQTLPADVVVFAMGAWTNCLSSILPTTGCTIPDVSGLKVHSIVLEDASDGQITADALFLSWNNHEPEVYPRPDNTVYICGVQSDEPPPVLAADVQPLPEAITTLLSVAEAVSESNLKDARLVQKQACYLPCSSLGRPIIGPIPGIPGAYVSAGHSCWGILLGPASGKAMAELILDGTSSIDLTPFSMC